MMVKSLYAHITVIAVSCTRRPKDIASITEFYLLWMSFDSACVENRLILTDWSVDVAFINRYFSVRRVLEITKYFGYDPRINPRKHQHKDYRRKVKKDSEDNNNPQVPPSWKSIKQTHSNIYNQKSTKIFFGFWDHKSKFPHITIIGNLRHLVYLILGCP